MQKDSVEPDPAFYLKEGHNIASQTFVALSTELQNAMKSGGPNKAIPYCNINALEITDSLSALHSCEIRRTSLKYRNPKNAPDTTEIRILKLYETTAQHNQALNPIVEFGPNSIHYYQPILTGKICLNCHGTVGMEIQSEHDSLIRSLYPFDKAKGYKEGELRGMWSLTFSPNQ